MTILRDPVWRHAPWVVVRHYVGYAVALLAGSAAFVLATLSGPTFVDAAEIALLQRQADAVPDTAPQTDQALVRAAVFNAPGPLEATVDARMRALPGAGLTLVRTPLLYQDSIRQLRPFVVAPATGTAATAVLFSAAGGQDATTALVPAPGSPDPGAACGGDEDCLWLPDTVADELGLSAGDRLAVRVTTPTTDPAAPAAGDVPARLTGVYLTDPATGAPRDVAGFWAGLRNDLPPWPVLVPQRTPQVPLVVAGAATFRRLVTGVGERALTTWDAVPSADPVRIADDAALVDAVNALREEGDDPDSGLGRLLRRDAPPRTLSLVSGLPEMVDAARAGRSATVQGMSAVRVVGIGFAWLVVALGATGLLRRRADERQALTDAGRSGVELTGVLLVETLLPLAAGVAVGLVASGPLVEAVVGASGAPPRTADLTAVVAVLVATVLGASALDVVARARRTAGRSRLRLPWRAVVLTLAAACAAAAYADQGEGLDTLTALLPLAAVGAAAIVLAALATAVLRKIRLPRPLLPRLLVARLARDAAATAAFVTAALTFGAVATGLVFAASVDGAAADKVAVQVGAEAVAEVDDADGPRLERLATDVPATTVWRVAARVDDAASQEVMAVDRASFADVALRAGEVLGRDVEDVLATLAPREDGEVPVLLVGKPDDWREGETHRLSRDDWDVTAHAVGTVPAFPGMGARESVLVTAAGALFPLIGRADPTRVSSGDGSFSTEVWADASGDALAAAADAAGVLVRPAETAAEAGADPALVARAWVTGYLRVSTVLAVVLGVIVLVGLHRRDADRRRLEGRVLADLGHPRRLVGRVAALQLAVVSVSGAVTGSAAAYVVTRGLASRLDPLPDLLPALRVGGVTETAVAAAALVAVTLLATLLPGGRGRSVNELLREA